MQLCPRIHPGLESCPFFVTFTCTCAALSCSTDTELQTAGGKMRELLASASGSRGSKGKGPTGKRQWQNRVTRLRQEAGSMGPRGEQFNSMWGSFPGLRGTAVC